MSSTLEPFETWDRRIHIGDEATSFTLTRELLPVEIVARFTVDGEPASKSRPRFTHRGSKTRAYTPETTRIAQETIGWKFREAAPAHKPDNTSSFGVMAVFFSDTRQRRDVDNMLKLVCDGLNGVAWDDDSQVSEIGGRRGGDSPGNARTEGLIYRTGILNARKQKSCVVCGARFEVFDSTLERKYCSQKCHYEGRKARTRDCTQCGREFKPGGRERARFCSRECHAKYSIVEVVCAFCGKQFSKPRSQLKAGNSFCDKACNAEFWRGHRKIAAKGTCTDCGGETSKKSYKRCKACNILSYREHATPPPRVTGYTPDQWASFKARNDAGESLASIGRDVGCSGQTIANCIKRHQAAIVDAGIVDDDDTTHMTRTMPTIHPVGEPAVWLEIRDTAHEQAG